jgi:hypothetical protein
MNCSKCAASMTEGRVAIRATMFSIVFFGYSYMSLFIRFPEKSDWEKILRPQTLYESWYCSNCGMLAVNSRAPSVYK